MRSQSACLVLSALAISTHAAPQPWSSTLAVRHAFPNATHINDTTPACLPQDDSNAKARAAGVAIRNEGYTYGPSLIGEAAPFPNGTLGNARTAYDMQMYQPDREEIDKRVAADAVLIQKAIEANKGLNTLDDYVNILYNKDAWKTANPLGTAPGIMQNYTQDLLFSMERLSQNSYPLQLVKPNDTLPFDVPANQTKTITGTTLKDLKANGNLFLVDHKYQQDLEKTKVKPQRYGAACQAYFFIHPKSGDFLPLAIKTNAGSDLLYTPLDTSKDWLLAKMIFNVNDFFHAQMFHLTVTHDVSEGVHQAALHTLSENHPVMIILERLMYQAYSSRIVGEQLCFNPGGHWDQLFYVDNVGCREYVTNNWPTKGSYESAYLETDLRARGLIDGNNNYKFKSFPFFDDASVIREAYHTFFTSFVDSYYKDDSVVAADKELQNWIVETTKNAKVHGFPDKVDKATLVDVLTHFGYIVSVVHHSLNGGDPLGSKASLPFHLNALYAPLPTKKGVTDLVPFLPPAAEAVHYMGFLATFNRPFYASENRTLEHAFSNDRQLLRLNKNTVDAASTFFASMSKLSTEIKARKFDESGLSMGMPFIYRTLDPDYIPFFSAV